MYKAIKTMEKLTYEQLKDKANKALNADMQRKFEKKGLEYTPFNYPQKDVIVWGLLNGYRKQRIQINQERKIYYTKP